MKREKGFIIGLGLVLSLIFCSMVWADGGLLPDQVCPDPGPNDLQFTGVFEAAYGDFDSANKPKNYVIKYRFKETKRIKKTVRVVLGKEHVFKRAIPPNPKGLCVVDPVELIQVYDEYVKKGKERAAEKLGYATGWEACLTNVEIKYATNCEKDDPNAKVIGEFTLRLYKEK